LLVTEYTNRGRNPEQSKKIEHHACTEMSARTVCMTQQNTMRIRHVRNNHMYTREGTGWMYSSACSNRGWPYKEVKDRRTGLMAVRERRRTGPTRGWFG
jgi:hypothetical protein